MRRVVDTLIALAVIGPPFYFWFSYTGPFQWLAELQLRWWHSYTEQITFIGSFLLWFLCCGVVGLILKPVLAKGGYELNLSEQGPESAMNRGMVALCIAGPLAGCAAGGYQWMAGAAMKNPVPVTPAELAAGKAASRFVSIREFVPLADLSQTISEDRSTSEKTYVPLAPKGWKPGQPVTAYVELREREFEDFAKAKSVEGVIKLTGLPGMVRTAFERGGLLTGGHHVMVDFQGTPHDEVFSGQLIIGISVVIGAVLLFRAWREGQFR